jgi:hypothetical protein
MMSEPELTSADYAWLDLVAGLDLSTEAGVYALQDRVMADIEGTKEALSSRLFSVFVKENFRFLLGTLEKRDEEVKGD